MISTDKSVHLEALPFGGTTFFRDCPQVLFPQGGIQLHRNFKRLHPSAIDLTLNWVTNYQGGAEDGGTNCRMVDG